MRQANIRKALSAEAGDTSDGVRDSLIRGACVCVIQLVVAQYETQ